VTKLEKLLDDPSPAIRLGAVRTVFAHVLPKEIQMEVVAETPAWEERVRELIDRDHAAGLYVQHEAAQLYAAYCAAREAAARGEKAPARELAFKLLCFSEQATADPNPNGPVSHDAAPPIAAY
jgi:hypothetical protein